MFSRQRTGLGLAAYRGDVPLNERRGETSGETMGFAGQQAAIEPQSSRFSLSEPLIETDAADARVAERHK